MTLANWLVAETLTSADRSTLAALMPLTVAMLMPLRATIGVPLTRVTALATPVAGPPATEKLPARSVQLSESWFVGGDAAKVSVNVAGCDVGMASAVVLNSSRLAPLLERMPVLPDAKVVS